MVKKSKNTKKSKGLINNNNKNRNNDNNNNTNQYIIT